MKSSYRLLLSYLLILCTLSCTKEFSFDKSPSERTALYRQNLKEQLIQAPHGWRMIYFPRVDSLLFRKPAERLEHTAVQQDKYGYGGYVFLIRFNHGNRLELKTDMGEAPERIYGGSYDIRLGSAVQLSFTTHTPMHRLVNSEFEGVSDFLYRYTDFRGRLIFTTGVSGLTNRPYIVLEALKSDDDWESATKQAQQNRLFFERMEHPQIAIRQGSRLFFQSDVPFKDSRGDLRLERERNRKRYHLFLALRNRHEIIFRSGYNGIGSGYVGTEEGLTFHPGFSINNKVTFYDFERVGERFVSELVSVYDTQSQRFVLVSKHLYPEGEPTNYIAEIRDSK